MRNQGNQTNDIVIEGIENSNKTELFKKLYSLYLERVFHSALFYTKNKENAEDITQEVFVKLWERLEHLSLENLKAYLLVMVRNSYLNKKKKEDVVKVGMAGYYRTCNHTETHDMIMEKECWALYEKALNKLPMRQKQVFELKDEGYKNNDIAMMLNISVSTVNNSIYTAMFRIREFVMQNLNLLSPA